MAVSFGNLVATIGRGLLPIADLIAALSSGLFVTATADTGVVVCMTGADRSVTIIPVDLDC